MNGRWATSRARRTTPSGCCGSIRRRNRRRNSTRRCPVADENGMKSGVDLQAAREARGVSVHQLAVELHVSDSMITALEKGDYRVLGEPVFVRGHLRNYARALGLPEADVLANYDQTQHKPVPMPVVPVPHTGRLDTRTREWSTRAGSIAVAVVLVALAITWWLRRP